MAWLKQVSRQKERIVTVDGIHQRQVVLVHVHGKGEVGELLVDGRSEQVLGQQAWLSRGRLDRHALEDVLERLEFCRELPDGLCTRQETTGLGDHEGLEGCVFGTAVLQDLKVRGDGVVILNAD